MSGNRLAFVAVAAMALTLSATHGQHASNPDLRQAAPTIEASRAPAAAAARPMANHRQHAGAGARAQDALPEPMPSQAEPLQPARESRERATVGRSSGEPPTERPGARSGPAEAGAAAVAGLGLHQDERTAIREVVRRADVIARAPECRFAEQVAVTIGRPFPRTTRVCRFPDEVQAIVPTSRRYRYLVTSNEIVVIDPKNHSVVEVIE
jgi:hypothetical protein